MQAIAQVPQLSVVKIVFDDDVRRVSLSSFEFDDLKATIMQLFSGLSGSDFVVKYSDHDDGDIISVSTKNELVTALNATAAHGGTALKLFVAKTGVANDVVQAAAAAPAPEPVEGKKEAVEPAQPIVEPVVEGKEEPGAHVGVSCNGCNMTPIKGARFKCFRCPGFNLCESCEAKNEHPAAHPLLKVRPEAIKKFQPADVHEGVTCDSCKVSPITGVRYKCVKCPNFDLCGPCEAKGDAHPADHPLLKLREARRKGPLALGIHHVGHGFRKCMRQLAVGIDAGAEAVSEATKPWRERWERRERCAKTDRFRAQFVRDVTLPDRAEVAPNAVLSKVWEMRNNGDVAWADNTKLCFRRGNREMCPEPEVVVGAVQPGQSVEVKLPVKTPATAGRCAAFFRLFSGDAAFGPRVWVELMVKPAGGAEPAKDEKQAAPTPAAPTPAPAPAPTPTPAPATKFPAQMKVLNDMGFANAELNEFLLNQHNGDVQKVAHFLLEKMYRQ